MVPKQGYTPQHNWSHLAANEEEQEGGRHVGVPRTSAADDVVTLVLFLEKTRYINKFPLCGQYWLTRSSRVGMGGGVQLPATITDERK